MNKFRENEVVLIQEQVRANVVAGPEILIPKGAQGTVVLVHECPDQPLAYEIEFFIAEQHDFALATVDASLVSKA